MSKRRLFPADEKQKSGNGEAAQKKKEGAGHGFVGTCRTTGGCDGGLI